MATWAVAALGFWLVRSKKWIALKEKHGELRKGNEKARKLFGDEPPDAPNRSKWWKKSKASDGSGPSSV